MLGPESNNHFVSKSGITMNYFVVQGHSAFSDCDQAGSRGEQLYDTLLTPGVHQHQPCTTWYKIHYSECVSKRTLTQIIVLLASGDLPLFCFVYQWKMIRLYYGGFQTKGHGSSNALSCQILGADWDPLRNPGTVVNGR